MSFKDSNQNVLQNISQRIQVRQCNVESFLAFGEKRNWCFLLEEEKGVLEKPITNGNWCYQEYDPNSITLHSEAEHRINEVLKTDYPIRQFVYGYIVRPPEAKPKPKPHIQLPDRAFETVASVATATFTLAAGAFMFAGYAFLLALSGIDPKIIAVLDTGVDEKELPWICLMSWEDEQENS